MASRVLLPSLRRPVLPPFSITPSSTKATASITIRPFTSRSRRVVAGTLTSLVAAHCMVSGRQTVRLDGFAASGNTIGENISGGIREYASKAKNPVVSEKGAVNPAVFRQVSTGSILGLTTGALLSFFSKPLAIIAGLAVLGLHLLKRQTGIDLIPYERVKGLVGRAGNVDVQSALADNVAFKLSFGVTCALAGFASF